MGHTVTNSPLLLKGITASGQLKDVLKVMKWDESRELTPGDLVKVKEFWYNKDALSGIEKVGPSLRLTGEKGVLCSESSNSTLPTPR